jgi:membrane protein
LPEEITPVRWSKLAFKVVWDAYWHFTEDDGWAMASHVALSGLLALFPFLIFGTALAGFLGAGGFSDTAIHLLFDTWPADIATPIATEIQRVLTIPRGGLLTVSVLAAAYFASNGVEALRISLNRAYRVAETRAWYVTRLASLGYVIAAVVVFAVISILLLAVPVATRFAQSRFPELLQDMSAVANWGLVGTAILLLIGLVLSHKWLPAGERRLIDVLPGVLFTIVGWIGFGLGFAAYLSTFANYAATYAGLASIMIVLIFLYMVGVIFMLGAELNAALMKYRIYSVVSRVKKERKRREEAALQSDEPADIGGAEPLVAQRREPR